jgi:preprotein translocase subunit SecB
MIDPEKQPGVRIAQIFLERANFEHRPDFLEFPPSTAVETEVDLTLNSGLSPDGTKGRIQITVSSKDASEPLYQFSFLLTALVEAEEEGANFPLTDYVRVNGLVMLYPFLRELVANVTSRGRFGPLYLNPVNFLALTSHTSAPAVKEAAGSEMGPAPAA